MNDETYKLCYVRNGMMWFSQRDPKEVWADDWNDRAYEHNAGEPYEEFGPFKKLYTPNEVVEPCSLYCNSPYSVQDINMGKVAWMTSLKWHDKQWVLQAGVDYDTALKTLVDADIEVFVPYEV